MQVQRRYVAGGTILVAGECVDSVRETVLDSFWRLKRSVWEYAGVVVQALQVEKRMVELYRLIKYWLSF
jgi:hypothetical protein